MKKTLLWILLAAILMTGTACGGETTDTSAENLPSETVAGSEEAEEIIDPLAFLPENRNFDGRTVTFLQGHAYASDPGLYGNEICYNFDDIEGGDIVAEAVYNRNVLVEEKLNVKIADAVGSGWNSWNNDLQISIASGDNSYDAVNGALTTTFACIPAGMLYNLKTVEGIDTTHEWWDDRLTEAMTFGDGIYALAGDINFYDNYSTSCFFFNYDLLVDYNMEIPYDSVREGTWTFDKLLGIVNNIYTDENGDGERGLEDIYGLVSNAGIVPRMIWGMNMNLLVPDENGDTVLYEGEDLFDALTAVIDDLMKNSGYFVDLVNGGGNYPTVFTGSRAVFMETIFVLLVEMRGSVEDHIGILPYPKADENQDGYRCPVQEAYCTAYGIPVSADTAVMGYVLEAMGAASVDTVTEAVINKNCMVKSARDEDSADMIRIIMDSAAYPTEVVTNWGDLYTVMRQLGETGENTYASRVASLKRSVSKYIEKDMEKILALQ